MGLESEKIYEDLLVTKTTSHVLRDENIRFRTKILNLEKQIVKYEKIVQELERSGVLATSVNTQQINENILVMTLRKRIQDLNDELNAKQEELGLIKKTAKFTNHQLLEVFFFYKKIMFHFPFFQFFFFFFKYFNFFGSSFIFHFVF